MIAKINFHSTKLKILSYWICFVSKGSRSSFKKTARKSHKLKTHKKHKKISSLVEEVSMVSIAGWFFYNYKYVGNMMTFTAFFPWPLEGFGELSRPKSQFLFSFVIISKKKNYTLAIGQAYNYKIFSDSDFEARGPNIGDLKKIFKNY